MKYRKFNFIDIELKNTDEDMEHLIKKLVDEDMDVRKRTRKEIAGKGKVILPVIYQLFQSENTLLRWEAAQVLKDIASPESIRWLIKLMEDEDMDIRWIASEALIKTGRWSVKPLLEKLTEMNQDSINLRHGIHHVLSELLHKSEKEQFKTLMYKLNSNTEFSETMPVEAHRALKEFKKKNTKFY